MFTKVEYNSEGQFRIRGDAVGPNLDKTVLGRWTDTSQVATVLVEGRECIAVANAAVGGDALAPGVVYGLR